MEGGALKASLEREVLEERIEGGMSKRKTKGWILECGGKKKYLRTEEWNGVGREIRGRKMKERMKGGSWKR